MPIVALVRPTFRTIQWGGVLAAIVSATYVVWNFEHQPTGDLYGLVLGLRMAAVALALGLSFVLDDPTEDSTGSTPISVLSRRALRVALTLPIVLVCWLILHGWAKSATYLSVGIPIWPFLLEVVALAAAGLAGAAIGSRVIADRAGGLTGAGVVVLTAVTATVFPWHHGLLTRMPGTAPHDATAQWWWVVIVVSGLVWWRMSATPGMRLMRAWGHSVASRGRARPAWFTRRPPG